jgi:hypothetical protein
MTHLQISLSTSIFSTPVAEKGALKVTYGLHAIAGSQSDIPLISSTASPLYHPLGLQRSEYVANSIQSDAVPSRNLPSTAKDRADRKLVDGVSNEMHDPVRRSHLSPLFSGTGTSALYLTKEPSPTRRSAYQRDFILIADNENVCKGV